jgi:DNA uptake protein ComE-like DNA-binding protein
VQILFIITVLALSLIGCTRQKQSPDQLREKTAEATAELKSSARAVAEGVKEGWNRDRPLDLNKATRDQLLNLPGFNHERADSVIAGRPYDDTRQLVSRHILPEREYEEIKDRITAKD